MIAYAITSSQTLHFDDRFRADLERFASRADWLLYRDKGNPDYRKNARLLAESLSGMPLRLFLHDDWRLAAELGLAVHFSTRGIAGLEGAKDAGLYTVASTHSIQEALGLADRDIDAVTLSPIFATPGKGTPLGLEYLLRALEELPVPVIALGGIVDEEKIEALRRAGIFGFASIRYFAP
ncbi:thiamine phosphate synthase [Nitratifractor sp.]